MEERNYLVTAETMEKMEKFSVSLEHCCNTTDFLEWYMNFLNNEESITDENLGYMISFVATLSESIRNRDRELEEILQEITVIK